MIAFSFFGYFFDFSHKLIKIIEKGVYDVMEKNQKRIAPKNPNKRICVAKNITFSVQKENESWIRLLSKNHRF